MLVICERISSVLRFLPKFPPVNGRDRVEIREGGRIEVGFFRGGTGKVRSYVRSWTRVGLSPPPALSAAGSSLQTSAKSPRVKRQPREQGRSLNLSIPRPLQVFPLISLPLVSTLPHA